jgi:uncharacterized protein (DUF433 family)
MTIPTELRHVLSIDPEVMSGAICFIGTRIPVQILLDNHRASVPLDEFLDAYPDLTKEQVQAVIDWEDGQARRLLGLDLAS